MKQAIKISAIGIVQGVGYRKFCEARANELGIKGTAKNLLDGSVEIYAEGEENQLKDFISSLEIGPLKASVKKIEFEKIPTQNFEHFEILQ